MPKSDSALVEAAAKFASELESYSRLGDLFLKTPLTSVKHLERANQLLAGQHVLAFERRVAQRDRCD